MKLEDIQHKNKSVAALIRYISNTVDSMHTKTPNYSILLGAGASVTSGISCGQTLTKEWKEEVWQEDESCDKYDTADEFFEVEKPRWFDPSNAYSSLFENRYELQRHRRMFVEKQVANKTPSIGYAYLVKLIENGFFNTVFTTNFDDLLNEAFYRYSTLRPIVCAHDSSISGVTITSSRPKIIKLHGDYLYENIKTTLRETDSLESNMRMKFQEFAKDFGLIVIGYSGQDHSIMDILKYLVAQEDYFKNGIFWCIRKEDKEKISTELSKLLWMDKVFFVEVDGFDELLAELNKTLNDGKLPINDDFLSRNHQKNIINDLADNGYLLSSPSETLKGDCIRLKHQFEENTTSDFLDFIREKQTRDATDKERRGHTKRKPKLDSMSKEERRLLQELVNEAFVVEHKNSVIQKIDKLDIFSLEDSQYKLELLELRVDMVDYLTDEEIKNYFDELIRLDPRNQRYYEIASNRSSSNLQSLSYLEKAVSQFPNDFYIYNQLAKLELTICLENPLLAKDMELCNKAIENVKKSLELNSSVSNIARCLLADLYVLLYKNQRDQIDIKIKELYEKSEELNPFHLNTLKLLKKYNNEKYNEKEIQDYIDFYKTADNIEALEEVYVEYLMWLKDKEEAENKILTIFNDFESEYIPSNKYTMVKADWLIEREYFDDALKSLKSLPATPSRDAKIMEIYGMTNDLEKLEDFYQKSRFTHELQEEYFDSKKDFEGLANYFAMHELEKDFLTKDRLVRYSFALLKLEQYSKVEKLLKPYYDNPELVDGPIIVNYLFARKKQNNNVEIQIKTKLIENQYAQYSDFEKFGAYCVIEDERKALEKLKKILKKCPRDKYIIEDWPIMENFIKNGKFQSLLAHKEKHLDKSGEN